MDAARSARPCYDSQLSAPTTPDHTELTEKFALGQSGDRRIDAAQMLASVQSELFGSVSAPLQLGRFKVLARVGAGGMGVVMKAYDPQLERVIALKVLRSAAGGKAAQEALLAEARSMAKVRHPNLVTVFETGVNGNEVFVAMEFVDGSTLRAWMAEHASTWKDVVTKISAAALGLAAVHAAGLVHRDFKPDNVLIDKVGRVQVTDFGLARPRPPESVEPDVTATVGAGYRERSDTAPNDEATHAGPLVAGSPGYLAPEQWRSEPATARSDQFSLCVTLYEALYGERPFVDGSLAMLANAVLEGSRRPRPQPKVSSVPGWLDAVIDRGLATDPADRFASIDALLEAVDRGRRRRLFLFGGAALAASSLLTAVAVGSVDTPTLCAETDAPIDEVWSGARAATLATAFSTEVDPLAPDTWARVAPELQAYAADIRGARKDACEATRVRGEASEDTLDLRMRCLDRRIAELAGLVDVFSQPDTEVVVRAVAATEGLAPVPACEDTEALAAETPLPDDPKRRARVEALLAEADRQKSVFATGRLTEGAKQMPGLLAEAEQIGFKPSLAAATYLSGAYAAKDRKVEEADRLYQRAFELGLASGNDDIVAWSAIQQIDLHGNLAGDHTKADFWEGVGRAAAERRKSQPLFAAALDNNIGIAALRAGDAEKAVLHLARTVELYTRMDPDGRSIRRGHANSNLGSAYRRLGRHDEALAALDEGRKLLGEALGDNHPDLGAAHNSLGALYFDMKRLDEAEAAFARSLEINRRRLLPEHPALGHGYNNLGEVAAARGQHDSAIASFGKALAIWEPVLGPKHPLVAHVCTERGLSLLALGKRTEARVDLSRALAVREKGPDGVARSRTRFGLAQATNAPTDARTLASAALADLPEGHADRAAIETWLVRANQEPDAALPD